MISKICEKCNNYFETKNKRTRFCGHSCAASVRNIGISRNRKRSLEPPLCLFCSKPMLKAHSIKYCNNECFSENRKKLFLDKWFNNPETVRNTNGLPSYIRKYLIEQADYKCSIDDCGWSGFNPVTGNTTLQVDHINGDAMDNRPENLRVICLNCHSLTSNWCGLNRGKATRKSYYKKVK